MMSLSDTIAAIASAAGGGARGIIRISGPDTLKCLVHCFPELSQSLRSMHAPAVLTASHSQRYALPCDVYYWPNNRSYTREPAAELHLIGSPPLVELALEMIIQSGARTAEPGEFTLRAFLAGRIDLTQAEAVLGVIDASNRARLEIALQQLAGGLSQPLHELRERLLDLLAHLEAGLDFVEEDIQFILPAELSADLRAGEAQIRAVAAQLRERTIDSSQPRVILRGLPNAGKSSLFNALLGRSAAIVSAEQGTTRDYLVGELNLGDQQCLLIDTAGVDRACSDPIQQSAQQLMQRQTQAADLEILCVEGTRPTSPTDHADMQWEPSTIPRVVIHTKSDLLSPAPDDSTALSVSSRTGAGLIELRELIRKQLADSTGAPTAVASTAARCREILFDAASCLEHAVRIQDGGGGEELVAAELRLALDALGRVVGSVYTDDLLDRIFSRFCIGK